MSISIPQSSIYCSQISKKQSSLIKSISSSVEDTVFRLKELLQEIFSHLGPKEIANIESVNRGFYEAARETLWKTITPDMNPLQRNKNANKNNFETVINRVRDIQEIAFEDSFEFNTLPQDLQAIIKSDLASKLPKYEEMDKLIKYHEGYNAIRFWGALADAIKDPNSSEIWKQTLEKFDKKEFSQWCKNNKNEIAKIEVISFEQISELPKKIKYLTGVKKLFLLNCQLSKLPKEIGHLSSLEILNLGNNYLESLPEEFKNLNKLSLLDLTNNEFTEFPKEICHLPKLIFLNLSDNQLTDLPEEMYNMNQLKALGLKNTKLTYLSEKIGKLTKLQVLDLENNQITNLPKEISNLEGLTVLRK